MRIPCLGLILAAGLASACTATDGPPATVNFDRALALASTPATTALPLGLAAGDRVRIRSSNGNRLTYRVEARDGRWVMVERDVYPIRATGGTIAFDTKLQPPGKNRSLAVELLPGGSVRVLAGSIRRWRWVTL